MNNQTQTLNPSKTMNQIAYKPQPIIRENVVDVTFDYDAFSFLKGNRPVDENHVIKLVKSMQQDYLQRPIDVNEKFEIIDGQHRFTAIKELGLPLFYVVRKGWSMKQVQVANSNNKSWTVADVIISQCELGNKQYQYIKLFATKYKISYQFAMILLNPSMDGTRIKQGLFEIADSETAEKIAIFLKKISKIVAFNCFRRPLVYTFRKLADNENFDFDVFLKKLEYQSDRFKPCIDSKHQIELIEEIYNYRNQNKVNLRINSK